MTAPGKDEALVMSEDEKRRHRRAFAEALEAGGFVPWLLSNPNNPLWAERSVEEEIARLAVDHLAQRILLAPERGVVVPAAEAKRSLPSWCTCPDDCDCDGQLVAAESGGLSEAERRSLGCHCTRLDDEWRHVRFCPVPAVERILAARTSARGAEGTDVEAVFDALDAQHDKAWHVHAAECCWPFGGAHDALAATLAAAPARDGLAERVRALIDRCESSFDEWDAENAPSKSLRVINLAELKALLAEDAATEGGRTTCGAGMDGECNVHDCVQKRDGEPAATGRFCPLPTGNAWMALREQDETEGGEGRG